MGPEVAVLPGRDTLMALVQQLPMRLDLSALSLLIVSWTELSQRNLCVSLTRPKVPGSSVTRE